MNLVTQQIAANAEESAGGAEELSGQSEELRTMVQAFQLSRSYAQLERPMLSGINREAAARRQKASPSNAAAGNQALRTSMPAKNAALTTKAAARMIPFEDADSRILDEF